MNNIRIGFRSFIPWVPSIRYFHPDFTQKQPVPDSNKNVGIKTNSNENKIANAEMGTTQIWSFSQKYKIFRDEDSSEIFDVEEEGQRYQNYKESCEPMQDKYMDLNLNRGIHGVFDLNELVDTLRRELAENIFVVSVPKEIKYVDYMVLCSAQSYRSRLAIANFVRYLYKRKSQEKNNLPKIEGKKSRDWIAMDLGNIALHIFSPAAREFYDLESLWAIGVEYDISRHNSPDPLIKLFEAYSSPSDSTIHHVPVTNSK